MFTMTGRRRREDARTDAFLAAIALSDRYTLDPRWELRPVPQDDVHPLPLSLVTLLVTP